MHASDAPAIGTRLKITQPRKGAECGYLRVRNDGAFFFGFGRGKKPVAMVRVLMLIIYNDSPVYNAMRTIQRSYVHAHARVDAYFCRADPTLTIAHAVRGDEFIARGVESVRGILGKTVCALRALLRDDHTHVVRTNVSTVWRLDALLAHLACAPRRGWYAGGIVYTLRWRDPASGIVDDAYAGTRFVQGTSIAMSVDVARALCAHRRALDMRIVDDVAIGAWVSTHARCAPRAFLHAFCVADAARAPPVAPVSGAIAWRNRRVHRAADIIAMRAQVATFTQHHRPHGSHVMLLSTDDATEAATAAVSARPSSAAAAVAGAGSDADATEASSSNPLSAVRMSTSSSADGATGLAMRGVSSSSARDSASAFAQSTAVA